MYKYRINASLSKNKTKSQRPNKEFVSATSCDKKLINMRTEKLSVQENPQFHI